MDISSVWSRIFTLRKIEKIGQSWHLYSPPSWLGYKWDISDQVRVPSIVNWNPKNPHLASLDTIDSVQHVQPLLNGITGCRALWCFSSIPMTFRSMSFPVAGTPIEEWARSVTHSMVQPMWVLRAGSVRNGVQDNWGKIQLIELIQQSFHMRQIWQEPGGVSRCDSASRPRDT